MEQVRTCTSSGEHTAEVMSDAAAAMFARNSFPDEVLEGPPENAFTPQPAGKDVLIGDLSRLKKEVEDTGEGWMQRKNTARVCRNAFPPSFQAAETDRSFSEVLRSLITLAHKKTESTEIPPLTQTFHNFV